MTDPIFYFTGTGNSLMISKSLATELGETESLPISRMIDHPNNESYERVGLVFPVYWGGLPLQVLRILPRLKNHRGSYIFGIAVHAGGPGQALPQLRSELQEIGLDLSAGHYLRMPSNYIIGYDVPGEHQIKTSLGRIDQALPGIVEAIRNKKIHRPKSDFPPFTGTKSAYVRFIEGVNNSDDRFWVDEKCTECGVCERVCPVQNITVIDGQPQWLHRCEQCLACINWCPERAIQFGNNTQSRGRYTNPRVSIDEMEA
ncbi:MAG: EFR1 family ferrodoxin [Candidatus Thorarchaeota archaeon]|jgi:ferredoxin